MSSRSWSTALRLKFRTLSSDAPARIAVIGVGDVLHGDDAVGPLIARALMRAHCAWLVLDAGVSPEAWTGKLRRFRPSFVLFVDAVDMGCTPGTIAWWETWESNEVSASTHTLPLHVLAEYLSAELGCTVGLLGIQPQDAEFGEIRLSLPVRAAANHIVRALRRLQPTADQSPTTGCA